MVLPDSSTVAVRAPEDTILRKLVFFRDGGSQKHVRDIARMLKVSREHIDGASIEDWLMRLGIRAEWKGSRPGVGCRRGGGASYAVTSTTDPTPLVPAAGAADLATSTAAWMRATAACPCCFCVSSILRATRTPTSLERRWAEIAEAASMVMPLVSACRGRGRSQIDEAVRRPNRPGMVARSAPKPSTGRPAAAYRLDARPPRRYKARSRKEFRMRSPTSLLRSTITVAALAVVVAAPLAGCQSEADRRAARIRRNLTPELDTLYQREDDIDNVLALTFDENGRMILQDLGRAFYTDRPSRLTPEPIPH